MLTFLIHCSESPTNPQSHTIDCPEGFKPTLEALAQLWLDAEFDSLDLQEGDRTSAGEFTFKDLLREEYDNGNFYIVLHGEHTGGSYATGITYTLIVTNY